MNPVELDHKAVAYALMGGDLRLRMVEIECDRVVYPCLVSESMMVFSTACNGRLYWVLYRPTGVGGKADCFELTSPSRQQLLDALHDLLESHT